MGLKDRYKGILATVKKKFYRIISIATGEIQKDPFRDFTGRDPQIASYKVRAQAYLPPPMERREITIPTSIRPFTDQYVYDKFEGKYRDNVTKQFFAKTDYFDRLADHKFNVMVSTVSRERPDLDSNEIGGLVDALLDRRQAINDIARDNKHRLDLLAEDEEYQELLDILGLVSP